jgi:hypothetical protein
VHLVLNKDNSLSFKKFDFPINLLVFEEWSHLKCVWFHTILKQFVNQIIEEYSLQNIEKLKPIQFKT